MNLNSLGDLAQGYTLRNRNASLKQDIQRLSTELSTGQVSDVRGQLAGNYSFLTDVERKVDVMSSYRIATTEASQFAGAIQNALGQFSDLASQISSSLISAGTSISGAPSDEIANQARATLDSMVSTLNGSFSGRSMFSGNATNQAALVDSDTLIANLKAAITGTTTPDDMMAAAKTWFADPAGFAATSYLGGAGPLSPFALSPNEGLSLAVSAADAEFTDSLQAAAIASLANDPAFALSSKDQADLFSLAGQDALLAQDELVGVQARIGFAEARIETVAARNSAEVSSLSIARNALLQADPYQTATQLEEVQFQLQSLYSVTVRMSQLSLVNYL